MTHSIFRATLGSGCVSTGIELRGFPLRELLDYDPETGKLVWRERRPEMFESHGSPKQWNDKFAGKEAFTARDSNGYLHGTLFRKSYRAHRIAWAIHYGAWPTGIIDHINGDPTDNRITNLRDVSQTENSRNSKLPKDNKSGRIGVHWVKKSRKWRAQITIKRRPMQLGDFEDLADAIAARELGEQRYGFHRNHGRIVS